MKIFKANVKGLLIGNGEPIVIQTMCNCSTNDIEAAVNQCIELYQAGAQMVRLTTQGIREVESLQIIKNRLIKENILIPLVADVHFSSQVAIAAASVADKVRINPGNFASDHQTACKEFRNFLSECKRHNTAVRIGINHGSLGKRITEIYGNTPKGMAEAMKEWVNMSIEENFYNIVLSLKASNTVVMVEAYRLLNEWFKEIGMVFPIHLGVTEAGNGDMGRIKSAIGLSTLLKDGIGDTIRVSLTEKPANEIPVARFIANNYHSENNQETFHFDCTSHEELILSASCQIGPLLLDRIVDDFSISATINGTTVGEIELSDLKENLLQASRRRFSKCEYVACPGCGRTLYNLEETFNKVKEATSHLKGLVIAVMGCIVNGPGEMADADYGYVGEGKGKVSLYRGKEAVLRGIPQEEAIDALLKLISDDINLYN